MKTATMGIRLVAGILTIFILALGTVAYAEEITISAGAALEENILKPVKEPFEKATSIKLNIVSSDTTAIAFRDLVKGTSDAAVTGFPFEVLIQRMKLEGFEVPDRSAYKSFEVARAGIVLFAHKNNEVAQLTKDQLKGIFTGKIRNWKKVGGSDAPIVVVISALNSACNATFKRVALDGEAILKEVTDTNTVDDLKQFIAQHPESVGFGPATTVEGGVKQIKTSEIFRSISIITRGIPSAKLQKLIDFIKDKGQNYIKK